MTIKPGLAIKEVSICDADQEYSLDCRWEADCRSVIVRSVRTVDAYQA